MSHLKQNFIFTASFLILLILSPGLFGQETNLQFDDGGPQSPQVIENIRAVLENEKPNLAILTGDIVTASEKKGESLKNWGILYCMDSRSYCPNTKMPLMEDNYEMG